MEDCFAINVKGQCMVLKDKKCVGVGCRFYKSVEEAARQKRAAERGLYNRTGLRPREYMEAIIEGKR